VVAATVMLVEATVPSTNFGGSGPVAMAEVTLMIAGGGEDYGRGMVVGSQKQYWWVLTVIVTWQHCV